MVREKAARAAPECSGTTLGILDSIDGFENTQPLFIHQVRYLASRLGVSPATARAVRDLLFGEVRE
jgi:hypothetical protein